MAQKSEVAVLDVLYKNEACHQDMLDIMRQLQAYVGRGYKGRVPSGGDLLTCERQRCAQQHVMDGDTPEERLEMLEPVVEDWHALMCLLQVLISVWASAWYYIIIRNTPQINHILYIAKLCI